MEKGIKKRQGKKMWFFYYLLVVKRKIKENEMDVAFYPSPLIFLIPKKNCFFLIPKKKIKKKQQIKVLQENIDKGLRATASIQKIKELFPQGPHNKFMSDFNWLLSWTAWRSKGGEAISSPLNISSTFCNPTRNLTTLLLEGIKT